MNTKKTVGFKGNNNNFQPERREKKNTNHKFIMSSGYIMLALTNRNQLKAGCVE